MRAFNKQHIDSMKLCNDMPSLGVRSKLVFLIVGIISIPIALVTCKIIWSNSGNRYVAVLSLVALLGIWISALAVAFKAES